MEENSTVLKRSSSISILVYYFIGGNIVIPIVLALLFPKGDASTLLLGNYLILALGILLFSFKLVKHDAKHISVQMYKDVMFGLLLLFVVGAAINIILQLFLGKVSSENQQAIIEIQKQNPMLLFLSVGILAPFVEEIVFRGVIYKGLKEKYNHRLAMIVSSFIFGFIHVYASLFTGDFKDLLFIFSYAGLGFVFSYVYHKRDNIYTSIVLHSLYNSISFLMLFYFV